MSTEVIAPPPVVGIGTLDDSNQFENSIHFYLSYKYLPLKNIAELIKNVNELYELVYLLLHDEKVPPEHRLSLDYAATGNSLEWIGKFIDIIRPSRKAVIALSMAAAIIYTPIGIEGHKRDIAERKKIEAEIAKTKAETNKINSEKESIDLENLMKRNKIHDDSIARVNAEKNRKKLLKKKKAIQKAVSDKPITQCVINDVVIINKNDE